MPVVEYYSGVNCSVITNTCTVQGAPNTAVLYALSHFYVSSFIHTFASTFALPTFAFYTYLLFSHFCTFTLSRFIPAPSDRRYDSKQAENW